MTQAGLWQLQKAVYSVLTASSVLQSLIGSRVYDVPPPDAEYPFILIGDMTSEQWGARDFSVMKIELSVKAFVADYRGTGLMKQIGDAIMSALDNGEAAVNAALAVGNVVLCQFHGTDEAETSDGTTWAGTTKFQILLETT